MGDLERFAPAKVNLFLHVGPPAPDGYHAVSSLMVFADVGDMVRLAPAETMDFALEGPFADTLGAAADNLVVRARDRVLQGLATSAPAFRLTLRKQLPIAAGLGGGSADAAATLVLVRRRLEAAGLPAPDDEMLTDVARALGADVAACLESVPVIATGRGDVLRPAPPFPPLDTVLVNPLAPSPTGAVYRAYDAAGAPGGADDPALPDRFATGEAVAAFLAGTRNDLQSPAVALQPLIGEVLDVLTEAPETRLARMSGSGATCFALCADAVDAWRLATRVEKARPDWWVKPCRLGGQRSGY
ncbi:MAG TPA: 4-(cytidine 5'-diphospho)-2-C-methyl-D-erythritol kinase [Caulobacteraceae bacterium]|nr:4-(cytidine 5'-diphospho)-2-C-methyl-D-erythritol kinase [Caulobacteraceae bacterium]